MDQTCNYKEAHVSPAMEFLDSLSLTDFLFCVLLDRELCGTKGSEHCSLLRGVPQHGVCDPMFPCTVI